jgi:hypothetical protein
MKKLVLCICLVASACLGQTRTKGVLISNQATLTFSATPAFDASKANLFRITLTGNVTSSTLTNAIIGQQLAFEVCQDATGGRTFVPPTNVSGWTTISGTANNCSLQSFWFDGSNALPDLVSPTISSVNGVSFPASPSTHSVPVVTASNTITYKVIPDCQDSAGNHLNYTQSGDSFSCGTTTPATLTSKVLVSPTINTGISQGSGYKHQRFTGCTATAGVDVFCGGSTGTWTSAFPDANYTLTCFAIVTAGQGFALVTSKTASGIILFFINLSAGSSSTAAEFDCTASHD